jgi:hypothetical protein
MFPVQGVKFIQGEALAAGAAPGDDACGQIHLLSQNCRKRGSIGCYSVPCVTR